MIAADRLGLFILAQTDGDLIVVKPAGTACALTSDPRGVSLVRRVAACAPPGAAVALPHRLDRVARGIVVVTLCAEAAAFHGERIRRGEWGKFYLARLPRPVGEGEHRLHLRQVGMRAEVVRSGGRPARLEVLLCRPAPARPGEFHALIRLLTGRFHQIRATMAHLGAPLVGDALYGGPAGPFFLEHTLLRHAEFPTGAPRVAHWREDPDREPVDPAIRARLDDLLRE